MLRRIREKLDSERKKYISFDVMAGDRYICTMRMPHNPLFVTTMAELEQFVFDNRPSLKKVKNLNICINENNSDNVL